MDAGALELRRAMIRELSRGEECAKQLHRSLQNSSSAAQSLLSKKIVNSFATVQSLLKLNNPNLVETATVVVADSPRSSIKGSPASEDGFTEAFRELERRDLCRKRKALPKWTEQVRINPETGPEGSVHDDGYNWRKYGQKDILGAKYPRAYYRCTHRHVQGCQATKQVQRSDNNPAVFDITYRGEHTCNQPPHFAEATTSLPVEKRQKIQPSQDDHQPDLLTRYKSVLKVETQGLLDEPFPATESFTYSLTPEDQQQVHYQQLFDQLAASGSPSFVSPTTPENYLKDISAATSVTNSPIIGTEFHMDDPFDILDHYDLTFHLPGFF